LFLRGGLMLDQGVWAEIKVGGEHLRLFSEHNAQGVQGFRTSYLTRLKRINSSGYLGAIDSSFRYAASRRTARLSFRSGGSHAAQSRSEA